MTTLSAGISAISLSIINLTVSVPLVFPHPCAILPNSLHMAASHTSRSSGTLMILAYLVIVSLVTGCTTPFAISAMSVGGNIGDNGTSQRMLATFLTWLSEKTSPVFIVSTANSIDSIPAELLRKGRFDEIFFLNLPPLNDRLTIFQVHLKKVRNTPISAATLRVFSRITTSFSGAEIEQVLLEAMRFGFSENREFNNLDILFSLQHTTPLAKMRGSSIQKLQLWASSVKVPLA